VLGEVASYLACLEPRSWPAGLAGVAAALLAGRARPGALARLALPGGLSIRFPASILRDVLRNVAHVYYYRDYEALAGFAPEPGWTVLDVGAFIGVYALRAASLVGPSGLVVAVEPLPSSYRLLELNVRANRLGNVRLVGAAVSDGWGSAELLVPGSPLNATLDPGYASAWGGAVGAVRVRTLPLDALIGPLGRVDLVKIDVEGLELRVVEGSALLRPGVVRRAVVEVHPPRVEARRVALALEGRGYEVSVLLPEEAPGQAFVYALERRPAAGPRGP